MKIKHLKHKTFNTPKEAFSVVKSFFKNQKELALKCGVCQQTISKWERCGVPIKKVLIVELAVNGRVTRFDLRPDFYPREQ